MKLLFTFLVPIFLLIPQLTLAQNYLVGIPGVEQGAGGSFDAYIQAVYVLFISIAALLAVVKIIIAGLKYMFTDIVTQKGEAKKDIQGALLGLLLVLSAVLILTVINPELTRFNVSIDRVDRPDASGIREIQTGACSDSNILCITIPCSGSECDAVATSCREERSGVVDDITSNSVLCRIDITGRITNDELGSVEVTCENTNNTATLCRAEYEQCENGSVFNGIRNGEIINTNIVSISDGPSSFTCRGILSDEEEEEQQEMFENNLEEDENLRRCEDPNNPNNFYWWDSATSLCRVTTIVEETLSVSLPASIAELQSTGWFWWGEERILDPSNPEDVDMITDLCQTEYGISDDPEIFGVRNIEYNISSQRCDVEYLRYQRTNDEGPPSVQPSSN